MNTNGDRVKVSAPAKLNLYLEVVGKRPDGYHELETVMQTVSLADELTFTPTEGEITLTCDNPAVPTGSQNLCVRAADLLRKETGCSRGVRIDLVKRVPMGAGLGGGSSDAAATLLGLNRLWKLNTALARLSSMAARLGADVPFFLTGGTALCRGIGEIVSPLMDVPECHYVLVCPELEVSTGRVYENVPSSLTMAPFGIKFFLDELTRRQRGGGGVMPFNRLEETTLRVYPQLRRVAELLRKTGCERVSMTGSGSAFFAACDSRKEAALITGKLTGLELGRVFAVTNTVSNTEV